MRLLGGSTLVAFLAMAFWSSMAAAEQQGDGTLDQTDASSEPVTLTKQSSGVNASLRGVCAVNRNVCWASGTQGICLRTIDGGQSWESLTVPGADEIDFRDVHAWSKDKALLMGIASPARFFLTKDGGQSWTEVYHNDDPAIFFDAVAFWDQKRGVAFGDPVDGRLALITTSDGGETWQDVDRTKIPPAVEGEGGFAASGTCLAVGKNGLALIGLGGAVPGGQARLMRSEDYGASWTAMESPIRADQSSGIFSLCVVEGSGESQRVIGVGGDYQKPEAAIDVAMLSSDGGKSWKLVGRSCPTGFRSAVAHMADGGLITCGPNGIDISRDGGETWSAFSGTGFHAISLSPGGVGWLAGSEGRIARLVCKQPER